MSVSSFHCDSFGCMLYLGNFTFSELGADTHFVSFHFRACEDTARKERYLFWVWFYSFLQSCVAHFSPALLAPKFTPFLSFILPCLLLQSVLLHSLKSDLITILYRGPKL